MIIPALLSKKANAPVMMRISREEETFIGRARPGFHGPDESRVFQRRTDPRARHVRDLGQRSLRRAGRRPDIGTHGLAVVSAAGHALARRDGADQHAAAQRAEFARRNAGNHDHRADHREGRAQAGARPGSDPVHQLSGRQSASSDRPVHGKLQHATSAFLKEALDRGAEQFNWQERVARNPKRIGSKVRGVGVSLSCYVGGTIGFDGLLVITPEGRVRFQSGIGNLGTESVIDVHRVRRRSSRRAVGEVRRRLGRHVEEPSVHVRVRRQPDDARDDARRSRGGDGCQAETAGDRREESGRQTGGLRGRQRARLPQRRRRGHDFGAGRAARD